MSKLFTYGSLMCEDIMARVARGHFPATPATLSGYARQTMKKATYPGLRPQSNAVTKGIVYSQLTPQAFHHLDMFEGSMYDRIEVTVKLENKLPTSAYVYVTRAVYHRYLKKEDWDFGAFVTLHKHQFVKDMF